MKFSHKIYKHFFCVCTRFNAYILFVGKFPDWKSKNSIGMALVEPHIVRRSPRPKSTVIAPECEQIWPIRHLTPTKSRNNCHICTYKSNPNVFATRCGICAKYVCPEQGFDICSRCAQQQKK